MIRRTEDHHFAERRRTLCSHAQSEEIRRRQQDWRHLIYRFVACSSPIPHRDRMVNYVSFSTLPLCHRLLCIIEIRVFLKCPNPTWRIQFQRLGRPWRHEIHESVADHCAALSVCACTAALFRPAFLNAISFTPCRALLRARGQAGGVHTYLPALNSAVGVCYVFASGSLRNPGIR